MEKSSPNRAASWVRTKRPGILPKQSFQRLADQGRRHLEKRGRRSGDFEDIKNFLRPNLLVLSQL